jgi:hypothetical protein
MLSVSKVAKIGIDIQQLASQLAHARYFWQA